MGISLDRHRSTVPREAFGLRLIALVKDAPGTPRVRLSFSQPICRELEEYLASYAKQPVFVGLSEHSMESHLSAHCNALQEAGFLHFHQKQYTVPGRLVSMWILHLPPEREAAWRMGFWDDL